MMLDATKEQACAWRGDSSACRMRSSWALLARRDAATTPARHGDEGVEGDSSACAMRSAPALARREGVVDRGMEERRIACKRCHADTACVFLQGRTRRRLTRDTVGSVCAACMRSRAQGVLLQSARTSFIFIGFIFIRFIAHTHALGRPGHNSTYPMALHLGPRVDPVGPSHLFPPPSSNGAAYM